MALSGIKKKWRGGGSQPVALLLVREARGRVLRRGRAPPRLARRQRYGWGLGPFGTRGERRAGAASPEHEPVFRGCGF